MNQRRRQEIRNTIEELMNHIEECKMRLEEIRDDEQNAFDNLPESIQYSERGEKMEDAISALDDFMYDLDDAIDIDNLYECCEIWED